MADSIEKTLESLADDRAKALSKLGRKDKDKIHEINQQYHADVREALDANAAEQVESEKKKKVTAKKKKKTDADAADEKAKKKQNKKKK